MDNYTELEAMLLQYIYASKTLLRPNCDENVTLLRGADEMIDYAKDINAKRTRFQHGIENFVPGLRSS
jgi:hypothetical protein